ncbi:MAG: hypothetical protein ACRYHA_28580 [Janthinobacterium lividum]
MKRVLLTTFPSAFLHHGGGEREINLLNEALNHAGVMSDIYGPTSLPVNSYDCVIHFSMLDGSELMTDAVADAGRRLILWPNLWFTAEPDAAQIASLAKLLSRFDAVVFKSLAEERHFSRYLDLAGKDVIRITPLVSPKFFRKDISRVFQESYGLKQYAIWPGIIEPQKNQLMAVEAFSGLDIDLVISGSVRDIAYAEQCEAAAGPNIRFIPAMPFGSELHLSALAHCSLFVELPLDFPGTSAIEAATMGCNLLLSQTPWTEELLAAHCTQVDPRDADAVRQAVIGCLHRSQSREMAANADNNTFKGAVAPLVSYLT